MPKLTILDGGMGRELQNRSLVTNGTIWSARALIEAPNIVTEIHQKFIECGAQVITTSNYSAVPSLLELESVSHLFEYLINQAGKCAVRARSASNTSVRILGSLPPLHHSYAPEQVGPEADNFVMYCQIAELLKPHVDGYICETMTTGLEARAAVRAANTTGKPVWVAWTLDNTSTSKLRGGESVNDAYALLEEHNVDGYLFNCCSPETISSALPVLRSLTSKPIGAYANAFGCRIPGSTRHETREDLGPNTYLHFAKDWQKAGASIIGGCCGIGPEHIAHLRTNLQ